LNKSVHFIQSYLLFAFPFVLLCMAWSSIQPESVILAHASVLTLVWWEALSWNLMLWFSILILFLFLLVMHPETRETTITRIARIKERDEREQMIVGQAARASFLVTLSILIFLLFVSVFSINLSKIPQIEVHGGRTRSLSIGLNFSLLDSSTTQSVPLPDGTYFETKGIPISKSAIILLIIVCQVGVFRLTALQQNNEDRG
jgi:hypothetical protein